MRFPLSKVLLAGCLFFLFAGFRQWSYYDSKWSSQDRSKLSRESGNRAALRSQWTLPRRLSQGYRKASGSDAEELQQNGSAGHLLTIGRQPSRSSALVDPAIILFCYDRVDYLNQTMESLSQLPGLQKMALYISQDGNNSKVSTLIEEARANWFSGKPGHAWLSQHYRWGLNKVFWERNHSHVIIVEDDMLFSKDFLTYMEAAAPILDRDPSVWCISSWNDNGLSHLDWRNSRLFRTSYFPGLGWMLRRQLWDEIGHTFPLQAWDHWMRLEATSKGRECICPEVNRNKNIGEAGANMQRSVFKRYLAKMSWSREAVTDWGDLSYLLLSNYDEHLRQLLHKAQLWEGSLTMRTVGAAEHNKTWLVPYKGEGYIRVSRAFKTWPFPRGHHHHTAALPFHGSTFILADQRFSELLPEAHRIHQSPSLKPVPGATYLGCDTVCREQGYICSAQDFWFINTCEELRKHFPCERGCAVELGDDVPNYVVNPQLPTYQTCLVTQKAAKCSARHPDTRRLCPCVEGEPRLKSYSNATSVKTL